MKVAGTRGAITDKVCVNTRMAMSIEVDSTAMPFTAKDSTSMQVEKASMGDSTTPSALLRNLCNIALRLGTGRSVSLVSR